MASGSRKARVARKNLPPVVGLGDDSFGYVLRHRVVSEDRNRFSPWAPPTALTLYSPEQLPVSVEGSISLLGSSLLIVWDDVDQTYAYDVFVKFPTIPSQAIQTATIANSQITFTTHQKHNFRAGDLVTVTGVDPESYNGVYSIISENDDKVFVVASDTLDPYVSGGTAEIPAEEWTYHGTTPIHTYSIIDKRRDGGIIYVEVQVESINHVLSDTLKVFEGNIT